MRDILNVSDNVRDVVLVDEVVVVSVVDIDSDRICVKECDTVSADLVREGEIDLVAVRVAETSVDGEFVTVAEWSIDSERDAVPNDAVREALRIAVGDAKLFDTVELGVDVCSDDSECDAVGVAVPSLVHEKRERLTLAVTDAETSAVADLVVFVGVSLVDDDTDLVLSFDSDSVADASTVRDCRVTVTCSVYV